MDKTSHQVVCVSHVMLRAIDTSPHHCDANVHITAQGGTGTLQTMHSRKAGAGNCGRLNQTLLLSQAGSP